MSNQQYIENIILTIHLENSSLDLLACCQYLMKILTALQYLCKDALLVLVVTFKMIVNAAVFHFRWQLLDVAKRYFAVHIINNHGAALMGGITGQR